MEEFPWLTEADFDFSAQREKRKRADSLELLDDEELGHSHVQEPDSDDPNGDDVDVREVISDMEVQERRDRREAGRHVRRPLLRPQPWLVRDVRTRLPHGRPELRVLRTRSRASFRTPVWCSDVEDVQRSYPYLGRQLLFGASVGAEAGALLQGLACCGQCK